MIAAIIGSRSFNNYAGMCRVLEQYPITRIVSGGAPGADTLAEEWSESKGLKSPLIFLPDWKKHRRAAGPIRNKEIINNAEFVVAFWNGHSKGTISAIKYARATKKPHHVWLYNEETMEILRLLDAVELR